MGAGETKVQRFKIFNVQMFRTFKPWHDRKTPSTAIGTDGHEVITDLSSREQTRIVVPSREVIYMKRSDKKCVAWKGGGKNGRLAVEPWRIFPVTMP